MSMQKILERFGVNPAAACGHSFGELTALCAAGWIDDETLLSLAILRGHFMASKGKDQGSMLAVKAPLKDLSELIEKKDLDVILANRNSHEQGVLSGPTEAIAHAEKTCKAQGFSATKLPVSAAFHSRLVKDAAKPFKQALKKINITPSAIPVFSNVTAMPYPDDPEAAKKLLGEQLLCPVDFVGEIENLYDKGIRIFVEVGPRSVLTGLVKSILKDRPFNAVCMDSSQGRKFGMIDLARALCHIASTGYPVELSKWEDPIQEPKKQLMNIPLVGTNYRSKTKLKSTAETEKDIPRKI